MKIIVDKINTKPYHSLSKKDIQLILSKIPVNWVHNFTIFKISAQLFTSSGWDRPVIMNVSKRTFNILSRGLKKNDIIKELLIEVFLYYTNINSQAQGHKLTNKQRKEFEGIIAPFYEEILKDI
ncbi:hypothetical protein P3875_05640 [Myroides sp. JBRI-B21084]|uniref:hypothetical protein n=1 Tax=Myroides sp. JBRI-B21084 TaxID=3119977 RepID=UPI0026E1ADED|nr:hypothetical protein [Paenimyroides cloacae]WKW47537.1 hypothetical protein P3875_05640 [Paenimyroides cloacae]